MRKKKLMAALLSLTIACSITVPGIASQDISSDAVSESVSETASNDVDELTQEEMEELANDDTVTFHDENGDEVDILSDDADASDKESSDELVLSDNDPVVDVTDREVKEETTDALAENYIKQHIDTKYAEYKEAKLVDALYGKQTLFDLSAMDKDDTPEDIMHTIEFGNDEESDAAAEKILTQMSSPIAIYDVDEESDYYVSFVNTLYGESNVKWLDTVFAEYNELGHVLEGCVYDDETGIAYLPKSLFGDDIGLIAYQVQLMYGVNDYMETVTDVDSVSSSAKDTDIYTTVVGLIDSTTTVQAQEGMNENELNVAVNGVPISANYYEYDKETGQLTVAVSPAACQTVSLSDDTKPIAQAAKSALGIVEASAITMKDMEFYKSTAIEIPSSVTNGAYFRGTAKVMYASVNQIHTGTEIDANTGIYGLARTTTGTQELIKAITKTGTIDESKIVTHNYQTGMFDFKMTLKGNKLKQQNGSKISGSFMDGWGEFLLECSHTKASILDTQSSVPDEDKYYDVKIALRFFKVERSGKQPYAVIGVITSQTHAQMGIGIYKLPMATTPETKTINQSQTKTFSEKVTVTVTKKDAATGAVLPGATFQFFEDSQSTQRGSSVTTDSEGKAVFTYTRNSKEYSKTSKNYTYVTNWNDLSKAQQKEATDKGWYKSKSAAVAAAKKEVSKYMDEKKKNFLNKEHEWFIKETQAPVNHFLNSTITKVKEAAGKSKVSATVTNGSPHGSIKVFKTNANGTTAVNSKDPRVTLEGAVYGVYAAQKILKSDNKTQAYAKDALVKTVTISKHRDGYYGVASDLLPGTYYVKEILSPYGFEISTVKSGNINLSNSRMSTATTIPQTSISMKDSETGVPLNIEKYKKTTDGAISLESGIMFKITDSQGNMLYRDAGGKATYDRSKATATDYTIITGASGANLGKASLTEIPIGVYTIEQVGDESLTDFAFISPQTFEVKVGDKQALQYTFYNNEIPHNPRLKVMKEARIKDTGSNTDIESAENGVIFDVYVNYDSATGTGDLVDVIVTGATSNRGGDSKNMQVISGGDITTAHAQAAAYAAYVSGQTATAPAGNYERGNDGEAISRVVMDDEQYTIVQVNKTDGYRMLKPFTINVPKDGSGFYGNKDDAGEKLIRYNDFDGEKVVIDKSKKDIKGVTTKEEGAKFDVVDIAKIKQLEGTSGYDAETYGYFPYEEYFQEGKDMGQEAEYRQSLSAYLSSKDCVLGTMATDSNGHAEMIIMPNSYLYQYDDSVSDENKGIAIIQTAGHTSYAMQPVLTRKDAYDEKSDGTGYYEYSTKARENGGVTSLLYTMTDKPDKVGYVVLYKYASLGVDSHGDKTTEPESNAAFQILNAETGVLVQTMPATNIHGYTKSSALTYGKYIIRQISGRKGYELSEDQTVELNDATVDGDGILCVTDGDKDHVSFTRYEFSLPEFFDAPAGYTVTATDNGKSDLMIAFNKQADGQIKKSANNNVKSVKTVAYNSATYDEGYEVTLRSGNENHSGAHVTSMRLFHRKGTDYSAGNWVVEMYGTSGLISSRSLNGIGNSNVEDYSNRLSKVNDETPVEIRLTKKTTGEYTANGQEVTNHLLNDATFQIVNKYSGKHIAYLTTGQDSEGEYRATLKGKAAESVRYGDYILREVIAPTGYQETETTIEVNAYTVKYEGDTLYFEVEMKDEPVYGHLTGIKRGDLLKGKNQDNSGTAFVYEEEVLPGATYRLYAREDIKSPDGEVTYHRAGDLISTATSDAMGKLEFRRTLPDGTETTDLYLGEYYVVETDAPDGYVVDSTRHNVSLTLNDADSVNNAEEIAISQYEINDDNKYAYAVLDDDGMLTFFRSGTDYTHYQDEFSDDEVIDCSGMTSDELGFDFIDVNGIAHSGKLYTNFENSPTGTVPPWRVDAADITGTEVAYEQVIRPNSVQGWFSGCENLETADLVRLDTQNVTSMTNMFNECTSLTELKQAFDTSKVTQFISMFSECSSLTFIDCSSWDTSSARYAASMFYNNENLKRIFISDKWSMSTAITGIYGANMFYLCTSLPGYSSGAQNNSKAVPTENGGYLTLIKESAE